LSEAREEGEKFLIKDLQRKDNQEEGYNLKSYASNYEISGNNDFQIH